MKRAAFALVLIAWTAFGFGCTKSKPNRPSGKYFAVMTNSSDFYRYGPQQGTGPDRKLPRDTLLTLIRSTFGYAKVKLTTGEEGYISSDDIRVAPEALVAALTATPTPTPAPVNYPEPKLPATEPAFEPTPIPTPSVVPN